MNAIPGTIVSRPARVPVTRSETARGILVTNAPSAKVLALRPGRSRGPGRSRNTVILPNTVGDGEDLSDENA